MFITNIVIYAWPPMPAKTASWLVAYCLLVFTSLQWLMVGYGIEQALRLLTEASGQRRI
jgi:hypothetical protein